MSENRPESPKFARIRRKFSRTRPPYSRKTAKFAPTNICIKQRIPSLSAIRLINLSKIAEIIRNSPEFAENSAEQDRHTPAKRQNSRRHVYKTAHPRRK
ncbi:MAG: hypothetical protein MPL62_09775 [Alphaproteobacteria bacterium]|nr:hypothetical protein [Alphaproteobacteria bacterium]